MSGSARRGAAPVGFLSEMAALEARAILYLRLWCQSPETKADVWNGFAMALGAEAGRAALKDFETLVDTLLAHARRPLMRHQLGCSCVGADEAAFARFLAAAAEGEREDAMLLACLMARADMAPVLAAMAEPVAIALTRLDRATQPAEARQPAPMLH